MDAAGDPVFARHIAADGDRPSTGPHRPHHVPHRGHEPAQHAALGRLVETDDQRIERKNIARLTASGSSIERTPVSMVTWSRPAARKLRARTPHAVSFASMATAWSAAPG